MKILSDIFLFILIFSILLPALIEFFFFSSKLRSKICFDTGGLFIDGNDSHLDRHLLSIATMGHCQGKPRERYPFYPVLYGPVHTL